jgi:exopolyphosphatase/guanosine-5'-triphosphate,3'-diphosphate pyrophosphatase
MKVTSLDLLATAAVRDASDGPAFMDQLGSRPGIKAHIVSGQDEARYSGYGVICGMPDAAGVMGDLGGGSLELVALGRGRLGNSSTLPIGPAAPDVVGQERSQALVVDSDRAGRLAARGDRQDLLCRRAAPGGPFARLHMEQAGYPLHIIHQYDIPADEARAVARLIAVQSAKSLEKMPGVSRRRIDTLPLACLALDRLLAALKPRNVVFSAFGLREGFYYSRLSEAERARHPLIAFAEEQGADWRRFDLSPVGDLRLADADLRRRERGRAHPAHRRCHLSDISWNDHPDYRAEQAYIRVLHLPAPGMSHRDRAVLAMTWPIATRATPSRRCSTPRCALRQQGPHLRAPARRLPAARLQPVGGAPGLLPQVQLRRTSASCGWSCRPRSSAAWATSPPAASKARRRRST